MNLCVSPTFSELHFPQPGDEKADQIFNAAVDLYKCTNTSKPGTETGKHTPNHKKQVTILCD